jgi:hypothetical protein
MCISYLTQKGFIIFLPLNDSQKYDLIFDDNVRLNKVQVKTTSQVRNGNFIVKLESYSKNFEQLFDNSEVDFVYILCENGNSYMIPSVEINSKRQLSLNKRFENWKTNSIG